MRSKGRDKAGGTLDKLRGRIREAGGPAAEVAGPAYPVCSLSRRVSALYPKKEKQRYV